ncbi:hypothetical protein BaRGS_00037751 [Batillaria attramentaria]|uniref:Uncharacterized protein n=1 Tax=Batillaria attramentaria TaxID=370345 RepID=A0ABD0J7T7_9CAEN
MMTVLMFIYYNRSGNSRHCSLQYIDNLLPASAWKTHKHVYTPAIRPAVQPQETVTGFLRDSAFFSLDEQYHSHLEEVLKYLSNWRCFSPFPWMSTSLLCWLVRHVKSQRASGWQSDEYD